MSNNRELIKTTFPVILILAVAISVALLVSIMIPILLPIVVVGMILFVAYLWLQGGSPRRLSKRERRDHNDSA